MSDLILFKWDYLKKKRKEKKKCSKWHDSYWARLVDHCKWVWCFAEGPICLTLCQTKLWLLWVEKQTLVSKYYNKNRLTCLQSFLYNHHTTEQLLSIHVLFLILTLLNKSSYFSLLKKYKFQSLRREAYFFPHQPLSLSLTHTHNTWEKHMNSSLLENTSFVVLIHKK